MSTPSGSSGSSAAPANYESYLSGWGVSFGGITNIIATAAEALPLSASPLAGIRAGPVAASTPPLIPAAATTSQKTINITSTPASAAVVVKATNISGPNSASKLLDPDAKKAEITTFLERLSLQVPIYHSGLAVCIDDAQSAPVSLPDLKYAWFRQYKPGDRAIRIEGPSASTPWYPPSADDIGMALCLKCSDVYGLGVQRVLTARIDTADPQLIEAVEASIDESRLFVKKTVCWFSFQKSRSNDKYLGNDQQGSAKRINGSDSASVSSRSRGMSGSFDDTSQDEEGGDMEVAASVEATLSGLLISEKGGDADSGLLITPTSRLKISCQYPQSLLVYVPLQIGATARGNDNSSGDGILQAGRAVNNEMPIDEISQTQPSIRWLGYEKGSMYESLAPIIQEHHHRFETHQRKKRREKERVAQDTPERKKGPSLDMLGFGFTKPEASIDSPNLDNSKGGDDDDGSMGEEGFFMSSDAICHNNSNVDDSPSAAAAHRVIGNEIIPPTSTIEIERLLYQEVSNSLGDSYDRDDIGSSSSSHGGAPRLNLPKELCVQIFCKDRQTRDLLVLSIRALISETPSLPSPVSSPRSSPTVSMSVEQRKNLLPWRQLDYLNGSHDDQLSPNPLILRDLTVKKDESQYENTDIPSVELNISIPDDKVLNQSAEILSLRQQVLSMQQIMDEKSAKLKALEENVDVERRSHFEKTNELQQKIDMLHLKESEASKQMSEKDNHIARLMTLVDDERYKSENVERDVARLTVDLEECKLIHEAEQTLLNNKLLEVMNASEEEISRMSNLENQLKTRIFDLEQESAKFRSYVSQNSFFCSGSNPIDDLRSCSLAYVDAVLKIGVDMSQVEADVLAVLNKRWQRKLVEMDASVADESPDYDENEEIKSLRKDIALTLGLENTIDATLLHQTPDSVDSERRSGSVGRRSRTGSEMPTENIFVEIACALNDMLPPSEDSGLLQVDNQSARGTGGELSAGTNDDSAFNSNSFEDNKTMLPSMMLNQVESTSPFLCISDQSFVSKTSHSVSEETDLSMLQNRIIELEQELHRSEESRKSVSEKWPQLMQMYQELTKAKEEAELNLSKLKSELKDLITEKEDKNDIISQQQSEIVTLQDSLAHKVKECEEIRGGQKINTDSLINENKDLLSKHELIIAERDQHIEELEKDIIERSNYLETIQLNMEEISKNLDTESKRRIEADNLILQLREEMLKAKESVSSSRDKATSLDLELSDSKMEVQSLKIESEKLRNTIAALQQNVLDVSVIESKLNEKNDAINILEKSKSSSKIQWDAEKERLMDQLTVSNARCGELESRVVLLEQELLVFSDNRQALSKQVQNSEEMKNQVKKLRQQLLEAGQEAETMRVVLDEREQLLNAANEAKTVLTTEVETLRNTLEKRKVRIEKLRVEAADCEKNAELCSKLTEEKDNLLAVISQLEKDRAELDTLRPQMSKLEATNADIKYQRDLLANQTKRQSDELSGNAISIRSYETHIVEYEIQLVAGKQECEQQNMLAEELRSLLLQLDAKLLVLITSNEKLKSDLLLAYTADPIRIKTLNFQLAKITGEKNHFESKAKSLSRDLHRKLLAGTPLQRELGRISARLEEVENERNAYREAMVLACDTFVPQPSASWFT